MAHFKKDEYRNVVRAGVIGHAVGDALGVPVESLSREELKESPVSEMTGYGSHFAPAGSWSDDTSMEIALMQSVVDCGSFNYRDIMENMCSWKLHDHFTANGNILDIDDVCNKALNNFNYHGLSPTDSGSKSERDNSNGSLMRILPVAFVCDWKDFSTKERYELVRSVSSLTHAHPVSILGCHIYTNFVCHLLEGCKPAGAYVKTRKDNYSAYEPVTIRAYKRILENDITELSEDDILSDNYVVHALEASIWCILSTSGYKEAVLKAVNLGEDTDTVGAITGSMAGIIYGYEAIPQVWLNTLRRLDYLLDLCDDFTKAITANK